MHPDHLTRLRARFGDIRPGAEMGFHLNEPWLVYNSTTNVPVESQFTEGRAAHAVEVLNNHERSNNRPEVYACKFLG